jgi:hypothetical protein
LAKALVPLPLLSLINLNAGFRFSQGNQHIEKPFVAASKGGGTFSNEAPVPPPVEEPRHRHPVSMASKLSRRAHHLLPFRTTASKPVRR